MGPAHLVAVGLLAACSVEPEGRPEPADTGMPAIPDSGDSARDSAETGDSAGETGDSGEDSAPPAVDADGDGSFSDLDCDDADATVFPGAVDPCDDVDQDCDGVTWRPGSCAAPRPWEEVITEVVVDAQYRALPVDDMTGDGRNDWLVYVNDLVLPTADGGTAGGNVLYAGGPRPVIPVPAPMDRLGCVVHKYGATLHPIGDINGDGLGDLLDENLFEGVYGLILAPLPSDGTCVDLRNGYSAVFDGNWWGEPGVANWDVGGDLDGDGIRDFVADDFGDPTVYDDPAGLVSVFRGAVYGDPVAYLLTSSGIPTSSPPKIIEDLDGDGLGEVAVSRREYGTPSLVISGPDAVAGDGAYGEDLAFITLDNEGLGVISSQEGRLRTAGDWTGDGVADLLVGHSDSERMGYRHYELMMFDGSARGAINNSAAIGSWVGGDSSDYGTGWAGTADFDCDGELDLLLESSYLGDDDSTETTFVIPHRMPTMYEPIGGFGLTGNAYTAYASRDIDGDGCDDLSVNVLNEGPNGIWFGWPIPFDDPAAW
ncbi:hypothetical protein LBMAG42_50720 [Deltaproteobacteria bacterium]|nr:hypothetical protein LBMAG42_50720 [Deltaproteobacteria bacterium]